MGKTALVCGLIAALPDFRWTAVKITTHDHGLAQPIWEETAAGPATDTARYLAAGAERSLLVTAQPEELERIARTLLQENGPEPHLIFESNSILRLLKPDLCLAVDGGPESEPKPSFQLVAAHADARVSHAAADRMLAARCGSPTLFQLADFERISPETLDWACARLNFRFEKPAHTALQTAAPTRRSS